MSKSIKKRKKRNNYDTTSSFFGEMDTIMHGTGNVESHLYADGGQTPQDPKPIYVSNPNDPRLKSYEDSLDLYNITQEGLKKNGKPLKEAPIDPNDDSIKHQDIKPIGYYEYPKIGDSSHNTQFSLAKYKKPVQPVLLQQSPSPGYAPDELGNPDVTSNKNKPTYADSLKLYNKDKKAYESETGLSYDELLKSPRWNKDGYPGYGYTESGVPISGFPKPKGTPYQHPIDNINKLSTKSTNWLDTLESSPKTIPIKSKFSNLTNSNYSITSGIGNNRKSTYFPDQESLDESVNKLREQYPHNLKSTKSKGNQNYEFPSAEPNWLDNIK